MDLKIRALKNVGSGWFGVLANILVGFFLSPFILHKLGDNAFGLWILIFSVTGYYGLFDLGIRSSIIRYVAKFAASRDDDQLAEVINTSLFSYSCVALLLLMVTAVGCIYVNSWFHVSRGFLTTARWLLLMVGGSVALGFPLSVFGGVLQGLQEFYVLNLIQVAATLLRALLIVMALNRGGGLLTVALVTVTLPLVSSAVYVLIVRRSIPLRFARRFVRRAAFRNLISYGSVTFVIIVAERLRFQTDALVIGTFLSAAAITYFSIGSKLVEYSTNLVDSMADIFLPMSSHFDATGDVERIRKLFIQGNRASAFVMFPICFTLIILGKPLIEVWVGPKYVSSYTILLLLLIPKTLYRAQAASNRILFGMAKHKALAVVALAEGVVNLILSIVLIHYWGIIGEALGTTIPLMCTSILFLPFYLCRLLNVKLSYFLSHAYVSPLLLCVPMIATLLAMGYAFHPHNYMQLLAQFAAGGVVYGVGLVWLVLTREPMGVELRSRFAQFMEQAFGR